MHLLGEGGEQRNALVVQGAGVKPEPVNHASGTQPIHVGVKLLRVLALPVLIAIDCFALDPVDFFPGSIVRDPCVSESMAKDIH